GGGARRGAGAAYVSAPDGAAAGRDRGTAGTDGRGEGGTPPPRAGRPGPPRAENGDRHPAPSGIPGGALAAPRPGAGPHFAAPAPTAEHGRSPSPIPSISGLASIIIPCWNQRPFTQLCLQALFRYTRPAWELIVINNGSTDDTPQKRG